MTKIDLASVLLLLYRTVPLHSEVGRQAHAFLGR